MMFRLLLAVVLAAYPCFSVETNSTAFCSMPYPTQFPPRLAYKTLTSPPDQKSPGIRVRLTTKGLNYINGLAGQHLQKEATKISIPSIPTDINKGPGSGKVTAWGIKIASFQKPKIYSKLSRPNRVVWATKGGSATVTGRWNGNYKWWGVNYKFGGTFTVKVKDIRFQMTSLVKKGSTHRPQINVIKCEAAVGHLDLDISGGIIGYFVNKFSGATKRSIRNSLQNALCKQTKSLNAAANQELGKQPIVIPLSPSDWKEETSYRHWTKLALNYELSGDPVVTPDYIDCLHSGEISWANEGKIPFSPHPIPALPHNTKRMLHLYYSDFIMNSLLYSTFNPKNTWPFDLISGSNPDPELKPFLRSTCPPNSCIGDVFRNISRKYPDAEDIIYIRMSASKMPNATIENGQANMHLEVEGKTHLFNVVNDQLQMPGLFKFVTKFSSKLKLRVQGARLLMEVVEMNSMKLRIKPYDDSIDPVTDVETNALMTNVLKPLLQNFINSKLKDGFPIPTLNGMEFVNPEVRLHRRTLEIATDIRTT